MLWKRERRGKDRKEEQETCDLPEEVPIVEDVTEGNEKAGESDEVKQKEEVTVEDVMEEDEVAEKNLRWARCLF